MRGRGWRGDNGRCLAARGLLNTQRISSLFTHFPYATGAPRAAALVIVPKVGGFACVLGLWGPFKWTLLRDWQFLLPPQPPLVFTAQSYGSLFPSAGTLGCEVFPWAGLPCSQGIPSNFYPQHVNVGPLVLPGTTTSTSLMPNCILSTPAPHLLPSNLFG